jgi:hypothetical protein
MNVSSEQWRISAWQHCYVTAKTFFSVLTRRVLLLPDVMCPVALCQATSSQAQDAMGAGIMTEQMHDIVSFL